MAFEPERARNIIGGGRPFHLIQKPQPLLSKGQEVALGIVIRNGLDWGQDLSCASRGGLDLGRQPGQVRRLKHGWQGQFHLKQITHLGNHPGG